MTRVAIVTGTNRGLGRKIAEILVEKYAEGFTYVFTQRSNNHEELRNTLLKINPKANFEIAELDITVKESRDKFIQAFQQKHHKVDAFFNNAGVADQLDRGQNRMSKNITEFTFQVNFFNTVEFTEELYPLLTDDGKIIEMSSSLGQLQMQPEAAQKILSDETLNKERLFQLARDYINNVEDINKDIIFNKSPYFISKALLNAYVRFVATKYIKPNQSVFAVNPGWVQTDMGGSQADLTLDQACPDLAKIVAEYPFGRHPLNAKLIYQHKDIGF